MKISNDPTNPHVWLARAKSNLKLAQIGIQEEVFLEDLCFEAQQAAEKAIKAVCVHLKIEFPKTHSLVILTDLLEKAGISLPSEVKNADELTYYAVQARYPGWDEGITETEFHRTVEAAQKIILWADSLIKQANSN